MKYIFSNGVVKDSSELPEIPVPPEKAEELYKILEEMLAS